jgi:hypothetical protein
MSSIFTDYATSYLKEASRFLTNNANTNSDVAKLDHHFVISHQAYDLLKKFLGYSLFGAAVAGSAFYFGFHYAKQRQRFDPRIREENKNEQVIFNHIKDIFKNKKYK